MYFFPRVGGVTVIILVTVLTRMDRRVFSLDLLSKFTSICVSALI
jgi:hypothetical protein